jgi:hypothetical protein
MATYAGGGLMVGTASRAAQPRYHFKERTARSLMPLSEASPIPPIISLDRTVHL